MTLSEINFQRLKEEFYVRTTAPKASRILRKQGDNMRYMRRLLRHHEQKPISHRETWKRDHFDCLLSYYSMLELALSAGLIDRLPAEDAGQAIAELSHPAVGVYYREHYRLMLPTLLLSRLKWKIPAANLDTNGTMQKLFLQYMPLAYSAETDVDMECFLWFLDDGWRGGYSFRDTLEVLRSHKRFLKSITKAPAKKTALDESVEGFGKFLNFAVELDGILQACWNFPDFQKRLYENHAYWFRQMGEALGKRVFKALESYVEIKERDLPEDDYFRRAKSALMNLLSRSYDLEPEPGPGQKMEGRPSLLRSAKSSRVRRVVIGKKQNWTPPESNLS